MPRPSVLFGVPLATAGFGFAAWKGGVSPLAIGLWAFAFFLLVADCAWLLWRRISAGMSEPRYVDLRRYTHIRPEMRESSASNDLSKRLVVICELKRRTPRGISCAVRLINLRFYAGGKWESPSWVKPLRLLWTTEQFQTVIQPGSSAECDVVRRNLHNGRNANIWTPDLGPGHLLPSGVYRIRLSLDGLGCRSRVEDFQFRWEEPSDQARVRGRLDWIQSAAF